jgi:acyl-coenzyme A synthetase/AMP-(fatty) acid ligase
MPKGVVITRAAYDNFLGWTDSYFSAIGPQDRLLNSTDFTFDVSLAEVAIALTRRPQFFCSRFRDDLFTLLNELHELRISVVATVPNNFTMLLDPAWMERVDLAALRHALIAGSRFPVKLARQFRRFLPNTRVHNCYGPTEATIYCLARELAGDEDGFVAQDTVSVGTPLPGCVALVVDDELRPVAPPGRGELLVGGAQVMRGYLNDPAATRAAHVDVGGVRYYPTGYLAFQVATGQYFVAGGNDDTVKVSGQRVNLSDIDGYVQRLGFVKSCATIAIDDEMRGALLVLYVVPNGAVTKESALDALRAELPRHQMPHDVRFLDALPLNNSGKVSKRALAELYRESGGG